MSNRLDYELTHNKIRAAIQKVLDSGERISVQIVADTAGVSKSAAYHHQCAEMIRQAIKEREKDL